MASRRDFLQLRDGRFSYIERGEGEPVVFLHALGRSAADWETALDHPAAGYRCLALDMRGHGESCHPGRYSFESMANDVRQFVDLLRLEKFHVVGHSMGANVAWILGARLSPRVLSLVIEDTVPPRDGGRYSTPPADPPGPVLYDWQARRQLFAQLNDPDPRWWDRLAAITCPTLVVAGREDDTDLMEAARLAGARLAVLGAGHWIHETEPESFGRLVFDHLSR